ncbi:MAG: hypothetical protein AAB913_00575 [Patescibacteria group bacterium]
MENLLSFNLNLSTGMLLGLTIGMILIFSILFLLLCYYVLAPRNIFFTFGRENRAMFVMFGKKFSGKVILPSQTIYVDKKYDIKKFEDLPVSTKEYQKQKSFLGMNWVGIYPFKSIYERHQQWLEWKSTPTGRKIQFRDEMTPYLIAKPFEYAMFLKAGEDKNGVPLNLYFTVILEPVNVRLPIFGNDDAYGQIQTQCLALTLLFVKEETFLTLSGENKNSSSIVSNEFSAQICKINQSIPGRPDGFGIEKVLGYKILDAKLDAVEITGGQKERLLEASTAKFVAEETAKATVSKAEGGLKATQLEAQGKKAIFDVQKEYLTDISLIPGAMKVEERKATPLLTTLVEAGNDKRTNLLIGGGK